MLLLANNNWTRNVESARLSNATHPIMETRAKHLEIRFGEG